MKPAVVSLSVDLVCSLVDDTHEMCFIVLFPQRGKQIFGFLFGERKRERTIFKEETIGWSHGYEKCHESKQGFKFKLSLFLQKGIITVASLKYSWIDNW